MSESTRRTETEETQTQTSEETEQEQPAGLGKSHSIRWDPEAELKQRTAPTDNTRPRKANHRRVKSFDALTLSFSKKAFAGAPLSPAHTAESYCIEYATFHEVTTPIPSLVELSMTFFFYFHDFLLLFPGSQAKRVPTALVFFFLAGFLLHR